MLSDGSAGELSPFYVVRNGEGEKVQHRGEVVFLASPNVDFRSLDVWSGRVGERVE